MLLLFARKVQPEVQGTTAYPFRHPANSEYVHAIARAASAIARCAEPRSALTAAKQSQAGCGLSKLRALTHSGLFQGMILREKSRLERGGSAVGAAKLRGRAAARERGGRCGAWLRQYLRKWKGVPDAKAPPLRGLSHRPSWEACAWAWLGVFVTLLGLSALNQLTRFLSQVRTLVYTYYE